MLCEQQKRSFDGLLLVDVIGYRVDENSWTPQMGVLVKETGNQV